MANSSRNAIAAFLQDAFGNSLGQGRALSAVIAAGGNISAAVDLGASQLCKINTPGVLAGTLLTFQTSPEGTTFRDLYDSSGNEYRVTSGVNRSIILPVADFIGSRYVKVRTGTAASPSAQAAQVTLELIAVS